MITDDGIESKLLGNTKNLDYQSLKEEFENQNKSLKVFSKNIAKEYGLDWQEVQNNLQNSSKNSFMKYVKFGLLGAAIVFPTILYGRSQNTLTQYLTNHELIDRVRSNSENPDFIIIAQHHPSINRADLEDVLEGINVGTKNWVTVCEDLHKKYDFDYLGIEGLSKDIVNWYNDDRHISFSGKNPGQMQNYLNLIENFLKENEVKLFVSDDKNSVLESRRFRSKINDIKEEFWSDLAKDWSVTINELTSHLKGREKFVYANEIMSNPAYGHLFRKNKDRLKKRADDKIKSFFNELNISYLNFLLIEKRNLVTRHALERLAKENKNGIVVIGQSHIADLVDKISHLNYAVISPKGYNGPIDYGKKKLGFDTLYAVNEFFVEKMPGDILFKMRDDEIQLSFDVPENGLY